MLPVKLGAIPTPGYPYFALRRSRGSLMVNGSHIPVDRNGYKMKTSVDELKKVHEERVSECVNRKRAAVYAEPYSDGKFHRNGLLRGGSRKLSAVLPGAEAEYAARYIDVFGTKSLTGKSLPGIQLSSFRCHWSWLESCLRLCSLLG